MPGYFGSEPTCKRCDYPRRLHHLLNVEHDYEPQNNENAPGAAGTDSEGTNRPNPQEGTDPLNILPDAAELVEAAAANHCTVTAEQAEKIRGRLSEVADNGYSQAQLLEFALFGAQYEHETNIAAAAAAQVDEIPTPPGFDGLTPDEWFPDNNGRIVRFWDRYIDNPAGAVRLVVTDEITDGRIVRTGPVAHVSTDAELNRDGICSLIDALTTAARLLAELGEAK